MQSRIYRFCDRPEYYAQLAREIAAAGPGSRVALATMPFNPDEPAVLRVAEELATAAGRGVKVIFNTDAFSFLEPAGWRPGPLLLPSQSLKNLKPPFSRYYAALEAIRTAGGTYRITNIPRRPFSLPQAGRSHIKLAVINNTVWLGGHNLNYPHETDLMTILEHPELADYLFGFARQVADDGNVRHLLGDQDQHVHFPAASSSQPAASGTASQPPEASPPPNLPPLDLYIDAGVPAQSRILQEALGIIDASREWLFFTCQYFPGGIVARHLAQAMRRGVKVTLIYSHPSNHGPQAFAHHAYALLHRPRLPQALFAGRLAKGTPNLHAKLLASEQEAMLGSHNYVTQGVRLGTAEIALRVHDPEFGRQAAAFVKKLLD